MGTGAERRQATRGADGWSGGRGEHPPTDVVITVTSDDTGEATVDAGTLTFTNGGALHSKHEAHGPRVNYVAITGVSPIRSTK